MTRPIYRPRRRPPRPTVWFAPDETAELAEGLARGGFLWTHVHGDAPNDCPDRSPVDPRLGYAGLFCMRSANHKGRHIGLTDRGVAGAWPGSHLPRLEDLDG